MIPATYYAFGLGKWIMLSVLIPISVIIFLLDVGRVRDWWIWKNAGARLIGRMIRVHEAGGDFTGATYILISASCTIALFSKPVAIAALAFIIVGDTCAAILGRLYGSHKFGRKSVEGSLGCLAGCLAVAALAPQLQWEITVPGAVLATVVEALSTRIDDNISVPLLTGLGMTLVQKLFVPG